MYTTDPKFLHISSQGRDFLGVAGFWGPIMRKLALFTDICQLLEPP